MSLEKSYYLMCESRAVLMTRQIAAGATYAEVKVKADERSELLAGCLITSRNSFSSKDTRSQAKKAGWLRHVEPGKYGDQRFDVCPVCAPKVVQP